MLYPDYSKVADLRKLPARLFSAMNYKEGDFGLITQRPLVQIQPPLAKTKISSTLKLKCQNRGLFFTDFLMDLLPRIIIVGDFGNQQVALGYTRIFSKMIETT